MCDPSTLRLLAYLNQRPGSAAYRYLDLALCMSASTVQRAKRSAESAGWLKVVTGVPYYDEEEARSNAYTVTAEGRAQIPRVLQDTSLTGKWDLRQGLWAETKGYGIRGMLVAMTFEHQVLITPVEVAQTLGITRRSASNLLNRWAALGGYLITKGDGSRFMLASDEAHHLASDVMQERESLRFEAADIARDADLARVSRGLVRQSRQMLGFYLHDDSESTLE